MDDTAARLGKLWDLAVDRYRAGTRSAAALFNAAEAADLAALGSTAQEFYDYAEDFVNGGEPDRDTAVAIELVRHQHFTGALGGRRSGRVLDEATMPPKSASVRGITWLPRILPKARAKLAGELPPSLMYSCGGDRHFFRTYGLKAPEFLDVVRQKDDAGVIAWVEARARANGTLA